MDPPSIISNWTLHMHRFNTIIYSIELTTSTYHCIIHLDDNKMIGYWLNSLDSTCPYDKVIYNATPPPLQLSIKNLTYVLTKALDVIFMAHI